MTNHFIQFWHFFEHNHNYEHYEHSSILDIEKYSKDSKHCNFCDILFNQDYVSSLTPSYNLISPDVILTKNIRTTNKIVFNFIRRKKSRSPPIRILTT